MVLESLAKISKYEKCDVYNEKSPNLLDLTSQEGIQNLTAYLLLLHFLFSGSLTFQEGFQNLIVGSINVKYLKRK